MSRVPAATEHQEQARLFAWMEVAKGKYPELGMAFAIPNFSGRMGKATVVHSAKLNREGRKKGVPDLMLPVPRGAYHGLFVEMKRTRGGALAPEQRAWIAALNAVGYRAVVCKGADEAQQALLAYLALPARAAA